MWGSAWVCSFCRRDKGGCPAGRTAYGEWRSYASDKANTKYTPLDQIDRDNVSKLRVLWRRPGVDPKLTETFPDLSPSNDFRATPLMLGGVLYTSNSVRLGGGRSIPDR